MSTDASWGNVVVADHLASIETSPIASQDLIVLSFDGVQNSTVFTDWVGHPHSVSGTARIAANAGPLGTSCLLLDSSSSYLEFTATSDMNLGTGDFTVEFWIKFIAAVSSSVCVLELGTLVNGLAITGNSTYLALFINNGIYANFAVPSLNTWYHVSVCRTSGILNAYWHGTRIYTVGSSSGLNTTPSSIRVGCGKTNPTYQTLGYISDLIIKKGFGLRTTASYTLPTVPFAETIHTDIKSNTFVVVKQPTTSANSGVPGGSLYFNGVSYLKSKSKSIGILSTIFSIDFWLNVDNLSAGRGAFMIGDLNSSDYRMHCSIGTDGSIGWYNSSIDSTTKWTAASNASIITAGTWYYIQCVKNTRGSFLYVNGFLAASSLNSTYYAPISIAHIYIGTCRLSSLSAPLLGYIQDFRITLGVDRSTTQFTVPTTVFSEDGNTLFLLNDVLYSSIDFNYSQVNTLIKFWPNPVVYGEDSSKEYLIYSMPMEGTVNQTTAIAESVYSGYTLTCYGGAKLVAPGKVGNTCLKLPGASGDYALMSGLTSALQFDFGGDDFTIECWFQVNGDSTLQSNVTKIATLISNYTTRGWTFGLTGDASSTGLGFFVDTQSNTSGGVISDSCSFPLGLLNKDQWYHAVWQIETGVGCFFLDGYPMVGRRNWASYPIGNSTQAIQFGKQTVTNYEYRLNGLIDEARIYRTKAKYSIKFTLPTSLPDYRSPTDDPLESFVILNMRFEGTPGDVSFLEEKSHVTTGGTGLELSLAQSRYGGTSLYLPSGNTGLILGSHADWTFAALDFGIEFWIYTVTATTRQVLISDPFNYGFLLQIGSSGKLEFSMSSNGSSWNLHNLSSGDTVVPLTAWNHIALTRKGSIIFLYLNGFLEKTFYVSSNSIYRASTNSLKIGILYDDTNPFIGYIDDFRITKNACRYSSDFVPAYNLKDPLDRQQIKGSVIGRDTDATVYKGYSVGSTSVKKYGNGSFDFSVGKNTNQYFKFNGGTDYIFGTGDFTVEGWFYFKESSASKNLIDYGTSGQYGWQFWTTASSKLNFYTNASIVTGNTTLALNTWLHLAVCRKEGVLYLFVNGVLDCTPTAYIANLSYQSTAMTLAAQFNNRNQSYDFKGYISEVRITKGVGRYTATFTPPAVEFPYEVYPLDKTSGRGVVATFVGGVYPEDVSSKVSSRCLRFNGDGYLKLSHANFVFGTNDFTVEAFIKVDSFSAPTDSYIDSVTALFSMDSGLTPTFKDFGPNSLTLSSVGSPSISTSVFKFGNGSCYFNGSSYFTLPSNSGLTLTGDFCVEFWAYFTGTANQEILHGPSNVQIRRGAYGANNLSCYASTDVSGNVGGAGITSNTWHHLAYTRSGTTIRIFFNGALVVATVVGVVYSFDFSGGTFGYGNGFYVAGYIDDLRITKGAARYTADFQVPTVAFNMSREATPVFATKFNSTDKWILFLGSDGAKTSFKSNLTGSVLTNITCGNAVAFTNGVWSHLALVRNTDSLYIFIDGILVGYKKGVTSWNFTGSDIYFGISYESNSAFSYFDGWMDGIRISNSARYIPVSLTTEQFPVTNKIVSGVVRDDLGNPVSRKVFLFSRSTGALLGTAFSDNVTGAFSFGAGEKCFAVVLDDDAGTSYNALILDNILPKVGS